MRHKIKTVVGSEHEQIVKQAGVTINRRENMNTRYVYAVHPMDNMKLIGCLPFDYYEEIAKPEAEQIDMEMLFEDVATFTIQVMQDPKDPQQLGVLCPFVRMGRYLANSDDIIVELDNKSPVYIQYIQWLSNITLATHIPDKPQRIH